jgi:hypothetical protein
MAPLVGLLPSRPSVPALKTTRDWPEMDWAA